MAERRMRLKRGKIGDTGVVAHSVEPPATSALSFPESLSQEPSAFDEDLVDQIAEVVGAGLHSDEVEGTIRHAIKLTMATIAMRGLLDPPRPDTTIPGTVTSLEIDVDSGHREFATLGGFRSHVRAGTPSTTIIIRGSGHPIAMMEEAATTFFERAHITTR